MKNGICKAELGELVEEEVFCGSGAFKSNKCACQSNEFYHPNMRECIKRKVPPNHCNYLPLSV